MRPIRVGAVLSFCLLAFNAASVSTSSSPAQPPASGQSPQGQEVVQAPLNPAFVTYASSSPDERRAVARSVRGRPLGLVPPPLDLWQGRQPRVAGEPRDPLPTSYDLRTTGKVTGVKDQNPYGTCWAHATFGSMESALLPAETWDFSENNLVNKAGFDLAFNDGGNFYMSSAYLARWEGPGNEADDPYPAPGASPAITVRKHFQNVDFIPPRAGPTDNSTLKQYVMDYGGVYTVMRWDDMSYNSATASFYYTGDENTNHAVLIAGWDDNYPAANFSAPPPANGAFLIKNSWGTSFGQSGYFWISYYDSQVATANAMFYTPDPTNNYDHIYQYDPLGWVTGLGYTDGDKTMAWFANVFTATSGQDIKAVSFYVGSANSPYSVHVFVNPADGDPTSGTLGAMKTGTMASEGYHTIVLDTPVPVAAGEKFSAVVQLTTPDWDFPIPIEFFLADYSSAAAASAGQSYFSHDNGAWLDATDYNPTTNVCVKAFTTASSLPQPPIVTSITPNSGPATGGTPVTVAGANFITGGTTLTVGGNPATSVVVSSATSLTAVTPAGTAGAKNVVATTVNGSGTLTGGFTYIAAPTVTGITPSSGPVGGGTIVIVSGTGFIAGATTVTIGGNPATGVIVSSPTSLGATTPAGTAGPKDVSVTTSGGTGTLAGGFSYVTSPTVTGITPSAGPLGGGTAVTISGSGFVAGATTVLIGGMVATGVSVSSPTSLSAVTPMGTAGPRDVSVMTSAGTGTLTGGFTYLASPTIAGITPNSGTTAGGTPVTITGTGFFAGLTSVTIGGNPATAIVVGSATSLTAVTPAGAAGAQNVVVTAPGGTATMTGGFTYVTGPSIASLNPSYATAGSGSFTLTVNGASFISGSVVRWNGSNRTTTFVGSTQLTASIPASDLAAPGTSIVTVYNPPGATSNGVEFHVAGGTASRTLPTCYTNSAQTVSIQVAPAAAVLVQAVEDAPPAGWPVTEISDGGTWDGAVQKVKWGPFFDNVARTLTYKVTPPAGQSGAKTFSGLASFDGIGAAIGGDSTIADACQCHPADLDMNFEMVINEVTGYGAAWRRGDPWNPPPSPIDINYVTRAGFLWRSGETYRRDPAVSECPLCWAPLAGSLTSAAELTVALGGKPWTNGTAFRTIAWDGRGGRTLTVTVAVMPDTHTSSWAVQEKVPQGWAVTAVSTGGSWDERSGQVKWGLFLDNVPRTLSYSLTNVDALQRGASFEGLCSFDGVEAEVAGRRRASRAPGR